MPTATLPARVLTTANTASEMECETCASSMTVTPNPYFGTGLAVHRFIAMCDGCDSVTFVPEPEAVPSMIERLVAYVRSFFAGTAQRAGA